MGIGRSAGKAWVVFSLTVRYLLSTRRGIATALLAVSPLIVIGVLAAAGSESLDIFLFQLLMVPLFLQVVLIFVALVHGTSVVREEIEDQTIVYLLTRPVSRPAILVPKYLGYLAVVVLLLTPPLVLAYVVTQAYAGDPLSADRDTLYAFFIATVLGAIAYGAFFVLLSVLLRRPLPAGLLFGFLWEPIVVSLPGNVPLLTISFYLRSILAGLVASGPLTIFPTDVSSTTASLVLVAFAAAVLVATAVVFQRQEFKQKA